MGRSLESNLGPFVSLDGLSIHYVCYLNLHNVPFTATAGVAYRISEVMPYWQKWLKVSEHVTRIELL